MRKGCFLILPVMVVLFLTCCSMAEARLGDRFRAWRSGRVNVRVLPAFRTEPRHVRPIESVQVQVEVPAPGAP